jgi:four helix bundle protein
MNKFRDLRVYQKAVSFSRAIYEVTTKFPKSEILGLTSQLRRASYSIVLNIAEGAGSGSTKEFIRFLDIAQRSTFEVMAGLDIAKEIGFLGVEDYQRNQQEAIEISVMLKGLQRGIREKTQPKR